MLPKNIKSISKGCITLYQPEVGCGQSIFKLNAEKAIEEKSKLSLKKSSFD